METLRTARLLLRPTTPDDWPAIHAYTSDPAIMRYLPEGVMTPEEVQAFIAEHQPTSGAISAILAAKRTRIEREKP